MIEGKIVAVCTSKEKGTKKENVREGWLIEDFGIKEDAHAGYMHRQVSLLAIESIEKMRKMGLDVGPGDFAENITTEGIDLLKLDIGDRLKIGDEIILEITQKGKECHDRCAVYYQAGDCVMPREGIFTRVIMGGRIQEGDMVTLLT